MCVCVFVCVNEEFIAKQYISVFEKETKKIIFVLAFIAICSNTVNTDSVYSAYISF